MDGNLAMSDKITQEKKHQSEQGDWYCPECKGWICSENVTFEETHDNCGTEVIWYSIDEDPTT